MRFVANFLAAAALMLLVASWPATADPGAPFPGPARQRPAANAGPPSRPAETRQEEAAQEETDEDAASVFNSAPLWYKMLPTPQGEQEKPEAGQNYMPALKDSWDAVSGQVSKLNPEQLKEAALAQMKGFRTTGPNDDQALRLPAFLQNILNDPESRKSFAQFALGALGMTAAGLALGDASLLRDLSLIVLYVAALTQFFRGGVQLAGKVASETAEPEGLQKSRYSVRQLLAKLLGARLPEAKEGELQGKPQEQD